jgi:hypothetical protein
LHAAAVGRIAGRCIGLAHPRSFDRIAVVTDSESIRRLVTLAGWSIPGELKLFPNRERGEAEAWASEGLDAPSGSMAN